MKKSQKPIIMRIIVLAVVAVLGLGIILSAVLGGAMGF